MDIAFLIATHSYCSRFGGRRLARPGRIVRGVTTHAEGKEEGHEEEGQEGKEEEIRNVDSVNVCASGRSRVSGVSAGGEGKGRGQEPDGILRSRPSLQKDFTTALRRGFFLAAARQSVYGLDHANRTAGLHNV